MTRKAGFTRAALLSRRVRAQLGALQTLTHELGVQRNLALRLFVTSHHCATEDTQREFWLEFIWADQEYRMAVRRLAEFCEEHRNGTRRSWTAEQMRRR